MFHDWKRSESNQLSRAATTALLAMVLAVPSQAVLPASEAPESAASPSGDRLELSLPEAIERALEENLTLAVRRFDLRVDRARVTETEGIFDLVGTAGANLAEDASPAASNLVGADVEQTEQQSWSIGLSQLTPLGGTAGVEWFNTRSETNSAFATLNPSYSVGLDLFYTQPLLDGFGREATEQGILVAQRNREIGQVEFELEVATTVQDVEVAYWELVEARAQLGVAEESLALARELHEQNRLRVEVGTLAPIELVQSSAVIATREEEIIRARAAVHDGADRLRQLLHLEGDGAWESELVPTTEPRTRPFDLDLEHAIQTALRERPEMVSQRLALQNLELNRRVLADRRKPELDLNLRYGLNGLGGDLFIREFPSQEILDQVPGGYSDALQQITDLDFDGWAVGLELRYPFQNRTAEARALQADLAVEQGETALTALEEQIRTEVRIAARAVETAAQQIRSAAASVRLAEESLDAERKRFENGMSTSFRVLEIQEDLTAARSREVAAETGFRRARAAYYRAIGELLEQNQIQLAADRGSEDTRGEG